MQMKINIMNVDNTVQGQLELSPDVFGREIRPDIISRVIAWQLAKRRAGTHSTKGISEVSGTTRKPYKQKGTGRARHGSLRSPQFRKGAVIFGPVVRSHEYDLQKKVRTLGLKSALSAKLLENNLLVVDFVAANLSKTKQFKDVLKTLGVPGDVLILGADGQHLALQKAASNLFNIDVLPQIGSNVYDIVRRTKLIVTPQAIQQLQGRLVGAQSAEKRSS